MFGCFLKPSSNFRQGLTAEDIKNEVEKFIQYGKLAEQYPENIVFAEEGIASVDMPSVYAAGDAFVLATRGEGWGRPLVEAMALGLPTIVTGWSGHMDYCDNTTAFLVDYTLEAAKDPNVRFFEDTGMWAKPDAKHLRQMLRQVYADSSERRQRAEEGRDRVRGRYDRDNVVRQFWEALQGIVSGTKHDEL